MSLSFDDAVERVTAPGSRFEIGTADVLGAELPVFVALDPLARPLA